MILSLILSYLNMYQNDTKIYQKAAALVVVHYMPSKFPVVFSKTTIFKMNMS